MPTATEVQEQEYARLYVEVPRRLGLQGWLGMTEPKMREALGLRHNRPLLQFHGAANMSVSKNPGDQNFLSFCLNLLFNLGDRPGQVTNPPGDEWFDGQSHPRRNLLWRRMMNVILESIDQRLPTPQATYRDLVAARCAEDPVFFTNGFAWGRDPRKPEHLRRTPFVVWPKQAEYLRLLDHCIREGEDLVVVKSREEGVSILSAVEAVRQWGFHDRTALVTSLDEEKLDNYKSDSFFGKLRDVLKDLPNWLVKLMSGLDYATFVSRPAGTDKRFELTKPQWIPGTDRFRPSGPALSGHAATGTAAAAGRWAWVLFDEFALVGVEKPGLDKLLWEGAADSTGCRVAVSSPKPGDTHHAALVASDGTDFIETEQHRRLNVFRITWRDDERKNRPLFSFLVRPKMVSGPKEGYGLLLQLHRLEAAGKGDSREAQDILRRCERLDPKAKATEIAREYSPWYLQQCHDRAGTDAGMEGIRTDLDAEEQSPAAYFFNRDILRSMDTAAPTICGDFQTILRDFRLAKFTDWGGKIAVWKKPRANQDLKPNETPHHYLLTIDASFGVGQDDAVIDVWDVTEWPVEQVAQFCDDTTPAGMLAMYAWCLAHWYNDAFIAPEANSEGYQVIAKLLGEMAFPRNRMYLRADKHPDEPYQYQPYGIYMAGSTKTSGAREAAFGAFKEELERPERPIRLRSPKTVAQLRQILTDKGCPAAKGHDDCVAAAVHLIPGLTGYQRALFGTPLFDVIGRRAAAEKQRREKTLEAERVRSARWHREADENIPCWGRRAA